MTGSQARPSGRLRSPWLLLLSRADGLGFGIPLYWWPDRRPRFRAA